MKQHLQIALDHEPLAWINGVVYSNRPAWYNVTARALHMDLIVPKERPHHAPQPAVLFLCGGAYMVMDRSIWLPELMTLARAGYTVASMEYRTSNEAAFPAALEDALKAVRHLQTLGYRRIYLAGDSAGGNLAACAAGKLRSQIAGILLYYPVVLAKSDNSESWRKFGRGFGLDRSLMEAFNESYAPGTLAEDPSVSPLLAREFRRWPETWIAAAECDVLRDQGRAFADRLLREGVRVTWRLLPGTLHAFLTYPGMENAYRDGLQIALDFLNALEKNSMNTSSGEKIIRLSRIEVDPARIPEYLALVAECGRRSMAEEPGVEMMYSMQEKERPERITILEIYADRAAYERHIRTPHFRTYKQRSLEMVRKLELLDQNPLVPEMKMK